MNKKVKSLLLPAVALIVLLSIFYLILFMGSGKDDKVKIGFIMSGAIEESGWNGMHYSGVKAACETLGVRLLVGATICTLDLIVLPSRCGLIIL